MKKVIALTLLLMLLISSACIASPYVAYADTGNEIKRIEQATKRVQERRTQRYAQQEQAEANDVERVRKILEDRKQKNEEIANHARIQAEKEEQERLIIIKQRKQQKQMILLCFGAVAAIIIACLYLKRKTIHQWLSAYIAARKISSLQISQIFLILFLLIVTTDRFSSGVYTLLRMLTTTISVWSATRTENNILRLIFAFIAILFNPIILIELDRDEWQVIDVATATFYFGVILYSLFRKIKQES